MPLLLQEEFERDSASYLDKWSVLDPLSPPPFSGVMQMLLAPGMHTHQGPARMQNNTQIVVIRRASEWDKLLN